MIYNGLLSRCDLVRQREIAWNVTRYLNLLAHLLNQHFQLDGGVCHSALIDFDARVFDSRLNSCIISPDDDQRLLFSSECCRSLWLRFQAVQFFGNVNSLCQQNQSCSRRLFSNWTWASSSFATSAHAAIAGFPAYGRGLWPLRRDAFQTLLDQCFQCLTFGFAATIKSSSVPSSAARISAAMARDPAPGLPSRPASAEYQPGYFPFVTLHFYPVRGSYQLFSSFSLRISSPCALTSGS